MLSSNQFALINTRSCDKVVSIGVVFFFSVLVFISGCEQNTDSPFSVREMVSSTSEISQWKNFFWKLLIFSPSKYQTSMWIHRSPHYVWLFNTARRIFDGHWTEQYIGEDYQADYARTYIHWFMRFKTPPLTIPSILRPALTDTTLIFSA